MKFCIIQGAVSLMVCLKYYSALNCVHKKIKLEVVNVEVNLFGNKN